MGLDLKSWHSWDSHYGKNSELMVEAFTQPGEHEPGKLSLLRAKLLAMDIAVDAINAVRDYRDLKINFAELKERTRPHIMFIQADLRELLHNSIAIKLMPRLTGDALREASQRMDKDPLRKLEWLERLL
jgi:hypothetical protein